MGIIQTVAFTQIFGLPLIALGGMGVGVLLLATLIVGLAVYSGKGNFTVGQHKILAIITVLFALAHGLIGMLGYLGF
jgi:hypothetical protein